MWFKGGGLGEAKATHALMARAIRAPLITMKVRRMVAGQNSSDNSINTTTWELLMTTLYVLQAIKKDTISSPPAIDVIAPKANKID